MYGLILSLSLEAPDIENDQKRKKRTFAVLVGKRNVFFIILAIAFFATLIFFALQWQIVSNISDIRIFFLLSFIPLIAGTFGYVTTFKEKT